MLLSEQTETSAMDADEYRAALAALGLTQEGFASLVGASGRTGRKWALGEARVPGSVVQLLRLLLRDPLNLVVLESMPPLTTRARKKPAKRKRPKART